MAEIIPAVLSKVIGIKKQKKYTRQGIYNAIRRGNIVSNSSGLIDTENKKNAEWIKNHGVSENDIIQYLNEIQEKEKQKKKNKSISNPIPKIRNKTEEKETEVKPEIIQKTQEYFEPKRGNEELQFENESGLPSEMMKLTLFQLVKKHGGPMMLTNWSLILNRLMSAQEKEQKIMERRIELIEKNFVISQITLYLETLSNYIFDWADSMPVQIISLVESDKKTAEFKIKKKLTDDFSIILKNTKQKILKQLEGLKRKYNKNDDSNN